MDTDLSLQAAELKNQSNKLVKEAEELNNSSQSKKSKLMLLSRYIFVGVNLGLMQAITISLAGLKPRLDSIQKRLQDAEKKKKKMLQDLKNIQNSLNASRGQSSKSSLCSLWSN